jgi:hypothetical protein
MSDVIGASIVFQEGDPPSEVYPTEGTIVGRFSDEHGNEWFVVHFDERNGYTFHPEEHVLVRPRWKGEEMRAGSELHLLTKPLPLGTHPVGIAATSQYSFGPWVAAVIHGVSSDGDGRRT